MLGYLKLGNKNTEEKNGVFYGPIIPKEFFDFGWNYLCEPTYGNIYMTLHRIRIRFSQPTEFDAEFFTTDKAIMELCKVSRKSLNNFRKWAVTYNLIHPIQNHRHIGSATVYSLTYPIPELTDEIRKACNKVTLSNKAKRIKKELKRHSTNSEIRNKNPKGCNTVTQSVNVGNMKGVTDTPHYNHIEESKKKTLIPIPDLAFKESDSSFTKEKRLTHLKKRIPEYQINIENETDPGRKQFYQTKLEELENEARNLGYEPLRLDNFKIIENPKLDRV